MGGLAQVWRLGCKVDRPSVGTTYLVGLRTWAFGTSTIATDVLHELS